MSDHASARDVAAAEHAAREEAWVWDAEPPTVPSPTAAMLEVVAHVRASDAAWDAEHPPPAAGEDVEWGVLVWAPDRDPYVLTAEDRDDATYSLEKTRALFPEDVRHLACRRVSPWQRVGEPLSDLAAPPAPAAERPSLVCLDKAEAAAEDLYPACQPQVGRHEFCRGKAIGALAGVLPDCPCPCHTTA